MFKGISLSLKGALWTAAGIIIVAAGVYAAWQLTDDDAEKEEQGVETTGQTVSEPEQVGTDQQVEEDSEVPATTTTTAPVEDQPEEEDSEEPTTTTTTAPVEDQPEEEDSEEPTTTTTTAPVEDQPEEEDSEEPTTTTTTAPVEDQQDEEDSEEPTTTTTTTPAEDQQDEEDSEGTTTTTTTTPAEDQQDEEDSEGTTTTTTTTPAEDQQDEEDSEVPTTTTTAAPAEDQQAEEDSEEPTTTTTAAPAEDQPRPMNSGAWNLGYVLMDMLWDCQFEYQTGECEYIVDGWNAEKIAQEMEEFYSNGCDYDLATESCRGWSHEDFEQSRNELLCGDWYHNRYDMLCYPTPQY